MTDFATSTMLDLILFGWLIGTITGVMIVSICWAVIKITNERKS